MAVNDAKGSVIGPIAVIDRAADKLFVLDATGPTNGMNTINSVLGITGSPIGTTDSQTMTNKTITAPAISSPVVSGTITGTYTIGGTPTFPSTVVLTTGTQTLTNKTLPSAVIDQATITRPTLSLDAIAEYTAAAGVTVDGMLIKDGTVGAGVITPNGLVSGTGTTWGYTSTVPTLTNITLGNGTISAFYKQYGKRTHYYGVLTFGSTTAITGQADISLPVNAASTVGDFAPIGVINARDTSANTYYMGWAWKADAAQRLRIILAAASGSYATAVGTTSTVPFTWTTSDLIFWDVIYENA